MDLAGRVAVVTGGGVGIGRGIAEMFADNGVDVVVNYAHSHAEAEDTVADLQRRGVRSVAVRADISDSEQVAALVAVVEKEFGRLDVLVNNAAAAVRSIPFSDLEGLPEDYWDLTMAVNLKGPWLCTRAAAPMLRANRGSVVNIASIAGVVTRGSSLAYCTAKAGMIHLTRCLAAGLAPDIRVNVVVPGVVMTRRINPAIADRVKEMGVMKTDTQNSDVASAVLECARNGSMTGATVTVDAGVTAAPPP